MKQAASHPQSEVKCCPKIVQYTYLFNFHTSQLQLFFHIPSHDCKDFHINTVKILPSPCPLILYENLVFLGSLQKP